jgi:hypothetical protein
VRQSIVDMLLIAGSPRAPDVFKIDMDIYNISVVDALLQSGTFTPRQILMEINEKTPPPIQFAIHQCEPFGWRGDHCFGISIEKVAHILAQPEYIPVALDWNNICSISRSTLNSMPRSADVRIFLFSLKLLFKQEREKQHYHQSGSTRGLIMKSIL